MLYVAEDNGFASYRRMSPKRAPAPSAEMKAYGQALRALRERKRPKFSQEKAADVLGATKQFWGPYEAGKVRLILHSDMQRQLCRALDVDVEELHELAARILETGVEPTLDPLAATETDAEDGAYVANGPPEEFVVPIHGIARVGAANVRLFDNPIPESFLNVKDFLSPATRLTRAAGEAMSGYVESGEIVAWEPGRWPQRGKGCVAVLAGSGEVLIRIYEGQDGEDILLREMYPTPRITRVHMGAIFKLGAVKWREG